MVFLAELPEIRFPCGIRAPEYRAQIKPLRLRAGKMPVKFRAAFHVFVFSERRNAIFRFHLPRKKSGAQNFLRAANYKPYKPILIQIG